MAQPDYLICLECDSPVYEFEWEADKAKEVLCEVCGNDDLDLFLTQEELDELGEESMPQPRK